MSERDDDDSVYLSLTQDCRGCDRGAGDAIEDQSENSVIQRISHPSPTPVQNVGVNHWGLNILVSQQFLNRADVVASFQQVRREAAPESVSPCLNKL